MNKKREAFRFYRSYYDTLSDIYDDADKLKFLLAILDKQFKGIEPELTGIPKLAYVSQKHSIDKQVEGWETKTKQKLYNPTEDTTEGCNQGGYEGGMGHPNLHPTEPPTQYPSNNSVMTTEGGVEPPTEPPYPQEQEQEKEQEKEQEHIATNILGEKEMKQFYLSNKNEIEFIRSQYGYSVEEAIMVHYRNVRELDKLWVN